MFCNDGMKTLLSRYVDGELSKDERLTVDDHLLGCEPCRELLGIFQKNENLVASALSTEEFGNAVVEQVISTIKKDPLPVARPIEESFGDWLRARPFLQLAATALLAVGLVFILNGSNSSRTRELKDALTKQSEIMDRYHELLRAQTESVSELTARANGLSADLQKVREEIAVERATLGVPSGGIHGLLYVEREHHIVVRAKFDAKKFTGYNVYRRGEKEFEFVKLNSDPLARPEFTDAGIKMGQGYVYKFEALRLDGAPVESAPILMHVPSQGDFGPDQRIRIHCENLAKPKDLAVFVLERTVDGKKVTARFYTNLGQRIGGREKVAGVGEVDFTTDLVLARIEEGTQSLDINYSAPVLDDKGQPIVDRVEGNTMIPKIRHYKLSVGTRESMKAIVKPVGTNDPKSEELLWRDGWMVVRAR